MANKQNLSIDPITPAVAQPCHYLQWANRGKQGVIRYLIGTFLMLSISLFFGQIFSVLGVILIPFQSPAAYIVKTTFFGFIVSFFLLPLIPIVLNRRPWWSLAMPARRFERTNLLVGFGIAIATSAILNVISYLFSPNAYTYNGIDIGSWVPMLFIAALAFFVQTSTEEMVYRGYLAQFVFAYTRNPFLTLIVPAFVFSLPHYGNVAGSSGFPALMPYILLGLMFGWIAYRSGNLWMSVGLHMGNNWFITMLVGSAVDNKITKIALFTNSESVSKLGLILGITIHVLVVIGVAEVVMRTQHLVRSDVLTKGGRLVD